MADFFFSCGSFDMLVVSSGIASIRVKGTDGKIYFTLQGGILYSRARSVRNIKIGILTNCSTNSGKSYFPAFSKKTCLKLGHCSIEACLTIWEKWRIARALHTHGTFFWLRILLVGNPHYQAEFAAFRKISGWVLLSSKESLLNQLFGNSVINMQQVSYAGETWRNTNFCSSSAT